MSSVDVGIRQAILAAFQAGQLRIRAVDTTTGAVGTYVVKDVLRHNTAHKPMLRTVLSDGREVSTTPDHSLFRHVNGTASPVSAGELVVGDHVTTVVNGAVEGAIVKELEAQPPEQYTYDLSVPGPENFVLSNGILAHNSYSIGGVNLDIDKASKYEGAYAATVEMFDKQIEHAKATVNFVKGLQQPKYGTGIRSSFGPYSGRGVLSPRKFVGV